MNYGPRVHHTTCAFVWFKRTGICMSNMAANISSLIVKKLTLMYSNIIHDYYIDILLDLLNIVNVFVYFYSCPPDGKDSGRQQEVTGRWG